MTPRNEKEMFEMMERVVSKLLPSIIRNTNLNIRAGIITNVNVTNSTVDVKLEGSSQLLTNAKYQSGANPRIGDSCFIMSTDPALNSRYRAIIFNSETANVDLTSILTQLDSKMSKTNDTRISVYRANAQSVATNEVIIYDTENYDPSSAYDTSTGFFTAPVAGIYLVSVTYGYNSPTSGQRYGVKIMVDSTSMSATLVYAANTSQLRSAGSFIGFLDVGDTISIQASHSHGSATALTPTQEANCMQIQLLSYV